MDYIHTGDIVVDNKEVANHICDMLCKEFTSLSGFSARNDSYHDDWVIDIDGVESGMEDILKEIITFCKNNGERLQFDIRYSGDAVGGYRYSSKDAPYANEEAMEYLDEQDIALADADSEHHNEELKRRNLSPDEYEWFYRVREHDYLKQDAEKQLEEYFDGRAEEDLHITDWNSFIERLVALYEDMRDCNIAENDTWTNVIAKYVKESW